VGFEPTIRCRIPDFESGAFDHSATSPSSADYTRAIVVTPVVSKFSKFVWIRAIYVMLLCCPFRSRIFLATGDRPGR
jgi:hypothetical protein